MNERERNTNRSLHALDEAHRLGRISREEYRSRRRHLLSALRDSHVVTARNAIVRAAAPTPPGDRHARTVHESNSDVLHGLLAPRHGLGWKLMVALAVGVLVCALLYGFLHMR